jgi:hypothetical protein
VRPATMPIGSIIATAVLVGAGPVVDRALRTKVPNTPSRARRQLRVPAELAKPATIALFMPGICGRLRCSSRVEETAAMPDEQRGAFCAQISGAPGM